LTTKGDSSGINKDGENGIMGGMIRKSWVREKSPLDANAAINQNVVVQIAARIADAIIKKT